MNFSEPSDLVSAGYVAVWGLVEPIIEGQEVEVRNKKYPDKSYKFTFSDIGDIYNVIKELLKDHDIAVMHDTKTEDGMNYINTILQHKSGQRIVSGYIGFPMIMDRKYDFKDNMYEVVSIKDNGGGFTSYRRYSLTAMFGLTTVKKGDVKPPKQDKPTNGVTTSKRDFTQPPADTEEREKRHPSLITLKQVSEIETLFGAIATAQNGSREAVWEKMQDLYPLLKGTNYKKLTRANADIVINILTDKYSTGTPMF